MVDAAKALDCKLRPNELQYCEYHRNNHLIEFNDPEVVDMRYGAAPVDIPISDKPDQYQFRSYCRVCHAYHTSNQQCGGEREVVEWEKKEIGI